MTVQRTSMSKHPTVTRCRPRTAFAEGAQMTARLLWNMCGEILRNAAMSRRAARKMASFLSRQDVHDVMLLTREACSAVSRCSDVCPLQLPAHSL